MGEEQNMPAMSTPTIACEHRGLPEAWEFAGFPSVPVWPEKDEEIAAFAGVPRVFLALTPQDTLLHEPRWAWVSLPEVQTLHLPSLDELRQLFAQSLQPLPFNEQRARLLHPLGQWLWALEQLSERLTFGDEKECNARLYALQRFTRRYWPGWFDNALDEVELDIANVDLAAARSVIKELRAYSGEVAALQIVGTLLRIAPQDASALASLQFMLQNIPYYSYEAVLSQSAVMLERLRPVMSRIDHDWKRLQGIGLADGAVASVLDTIVTAFERFADFDAVVCASTSNEETWSPDAVAAVAVELGKLADAVPTLQACRDALCEQLSRVVAATRCALAASGVGESTLGAGSQQTIVLGTDLS